MVASILDVYDFGQLRTVVDVGGNFFVPTTTSHLKETHSSETR